MCWVLGEMQKRQKRLRSCESPGTVGKAVGNRQKCVCAVKKLAPKQEVGIMGCGSGPASTSLGNPKQVLLYSDSICQMRVWTR